MQHAAGVGESHRVANAEEETQTVRERMDGFDVLVEALAFHKLHGVEDAAVGKRADVVDGDDAGMLEAGGGGGVAGWAGRGGAGGDGDGGGFVGHAALPRFVLRRGGGAPAPPGATL